VPEPRSAVASLKEYHPPLGDRVGLRLDFNENTQGCSPRVLERLREITPDDLARYPERAPVEKTVAAFLGLAPEQVLLTAGVDEAIHLACEAFLEPGDEVLIVSPTFAMYEVLAAATGATVRAVPAIPNFQFPAEVLLASVSGKTRMIAIANPNNPTGAAIDPALLIALAEMARDVVIFVDEAYFEFYGRTAIDGVQRLPNLLVARTFSKAYGLAALRVGAVAGSSLMISALRRLATPYNVNGVALACVEVALADQEYIREYVAQVRAGRDVLQRELLRLNITSWPSEANFVLAAFGGAHREFVDGMRRRGILVRDRSSDPGCDGCVRITVGSDEHNRRLLTALDEVVRELRQLRGAAQ
jgi:histidinol-phosphate aminotransferase